MEAAKQEILKILIDDLKAHDEFEEKDVELRTNWINSKSVEYFIEHNWGKMKHDKEISDIIYSMYLMHSEDYAIYDVVEKYTDIVENELKK